MILLLLLVMAVILALLILLLLGGYSFAHPLHQTPSELQRRNGDARGQGERIRVSVASPGCVQGQEHLGGSARSGGRDEDGPFSTEGAEAGLD